MNWFGLYVVAAILAGLSAAAWIGSASRVWWLRRTREHRRDRARRTLTGPYAPLRDYPADVDGREVFCVYYELGHVAMRVADALVASLSEHLGGILTDSASVSRIDGPVI